MRHPGRLVALSLLVLLIGSAANATPTEAQSGGNQGAGATLEGDNYHAELELAWGGIIRIDPGTILEIPGTATLAPESATNVTIVLRFDAPPTSDWAFTAEPSSIRLAPGGEAGFKVTVGAGERPRPAQLDVVLLVEPLPDERDGVVLGVQWEAQVATSGRGMVLGLWENPLAGTFGEPWDTFLANLIAWTLISVAVALLVDPTLRALTYRTKTKLDDKIIRILRYPLFLVLFTFGAKQSVEVFDLPLWVFPILDKIWLIVLVIAAVYASYRIWQEIILIIGRRMARRTETQLDDRLLPVFEKVGGFLIIAAGVFYILDSLGVNMTLFAAGGAVTSLVIAFAAQDTLANFFAGIFLLIDQPFKEGDDILLDSGEVCEVTHIGLRSTELYHKANHETIIVPNHILANNRTINLLKPDNRYKVRVDIGVAYGTDVQEVKQTLLSIARAHPLTLKDSDHEAFVRFQAFGASSLDFSLHCWVGDVYERWLVASDLREMIDQEFAKKRIEIPFPQRVVWQGRDEADRLNKQRATAGPSTPVEGHATRSDHAAAHRQVGASSETSGSAGSGGGEGGDGGGDGDV